MPSSIAINDAIIEKLISHAQVTSRKISKEEISKLVIVGENIAKALAKHAQNAEGANKSPLPSIAGENGSLTIESNTYTTRALSWYMMASAAAQDVERQNLHGDSSTSDMVTFGSITMKDPNNAIYNFLKKSNDAAPRTSTHFHDRAGHNNQHYYFSIIPSGQHSQWGIEDYEGLLPGHGGALLFDKLRVSEIDQCPELFIKFEAVGCPNWIDDATYNDNFHATSLAYSLAAGVSLNIQHALEFFSTRSSSHTENPNENVRQEHLYKGRLEELFSELGIGFDIAYKENIDLIKKDANEIPIASLMKKEGLPAAQREIERIEEIADKTSNADLKKKMQNLSSAIEKEIRNLGLVSDRHGIQRRGAEVHISLDAEKVGAALHKNWGNQGFQPDDASRSLMPADALAPDHIVDITPSHPPQRAPGSEALSVKV